MTTTPKRRPTLFSRRELLKTALGGVVLVAVPRQSPPANDCILFNGKFVDGRGVVGSALTIRNGRVANIGQTYSPVPGVQTIDLEGRTVIPGLFDAHVHYTRAGINPGHEARR